MNCGEGGSDEELCNLKRSKGSLDDIGNAVAEGRDGVVCVLRASQL